MPSIKDEPMWERVKRKLLGEDQAAKEPLHKRVQAKPGDSLVGKGPTNPFSSSTEYSKASMDTGAAAWKAALGGELENKPTMTKDKFKRIKQLADQGSPEAKEMLSRLKGADDTDESPDDLYNRLYKYKGQSGDDK